VAILLAPTVRGGLKNGGSVVRSAKEERMEYLVNYSLRADTLKRFGSAVQEATCGSRVRSLPVINGLPERSFAMCHAPSPF
jgi:hypothetical protein